MHYSLKCELWGWRYGRRRRRRLKEEEEEEDEGGNTRIFPLHSFSHPQRPEFFAKTRRPPLHSKNNTRLNDKKLASEQLRCQTHRPKREFPTRSIEQGTYKSRELPPLSSSASPPTISEGGRVWRWVGVGVWVVGGRGCLLYTS